MDYEGRAVVGGVGRDDRYRRELAGLDKQNENVRSNLHAVASPASGRPMSDDVTRASIFLAYARATTCNQNSSTSQAIRQH